MLKKSKAVKRTPAVDFQLQDEGSLVLLHPISAEAKEWISLHIADDAPMFGSAVAIEHRHVKYILKAIDTEGLLYQETQ